MIPKEEIFQKRSQQCLKTVLIDQDKPTIKSPRSQYELQHFFHKQIVWAAIHFIALHSFCSFNICVNIWSNLARNIRDKTIDT